MTMRETRTRHQPCAGRLHFTGVIMSLLVCHLALTDGKEAEAAEAVCSQPHVIFCDDFESGNLSSWQDGYNPALHRITTHSTNVYAGQRALEVTYPAGGEGGWLTRWFMPGFDHAFARLYLKLQSGWRCGQNCTKLFGFYGNRIDNQWSGFGKAGTRPNGTDFFFTALVTLNWYRQPDPGEIIFYSYFPDMAQAPDGRYWGNYFFQTDPRDALLTDRWYCLELEVQANTPGQHNGLQRLWIDGTAKGEAQNIRWRDTTDLKINAFQLTFSGTVPVTEHLWVDNVVVSTQKIGCADSNSDTTAPAPPTNLRVS